MARRSYYSGERETPKQKITWYGIKRFIRLFRYLRPQRYPFAAGMFFLLFGSLIFLAFPMLMGELLDSAVEGSMQEINRIGLILLGIFALNAIFSYFRIYLFALVSEKTLALLRQDTYDHLIRLPMVFFSSRRVGELNSRISADIALLQDTFTSTLAQFIRQMVTIIGGIALLTIISPHLTLFMLALVPVAAIIARVFGGFIRKLSKKAQGKVAESNTIVEETLQAITNVKAFTNEAFEIIRYKKKTEEVVNVGLSGAKWRGLFVSIIFFALFGSIIGVVWYGVYLVNQGEGLSSGDLIKFVLYSVFIGGSISGLADLYSQMQKAIGATENLLDILEEEPEPVMKDSKMKPECCLGKVEFKDVSFSYPSREEVRVLKNISFTVSKGQQVALVGPSGSGKTTISALLLRFYVPTSGVVLVDDRNSEDYDLTELRSHMAIVPQEVILFGGTITENIAYGNPDASEEEIILAAKRANAKEFIDGFPDGYNTIVGERGIQLSGGQRQRIAIARAILKDPAILILDEATSSLDSESERLVQDALEELMKGRTSFIIAHRLSTIHKADKILVIDKGEVKESGTHEELIGQKDSIYRKLNELQIEIMG